MVNGDGFPCLGTIVDEFASRVVYTQLALLLQLHDGSCRELLRNRPKPELILRSSRYVQLDVGETITFLQESLAALGHQHCTHEALQLFLCLEQFVHPSCEILRGDRQGIGRQENELS